MRAKSIIAALCIIFILVAGCGRNGVDMALDKARKAIDSHDRTNAAKYVDEAIAISPSDPEILFRVMVMYTRPGFHKEQVSAANKLVEALDSSSDSAKLSRQTKAKLYTATAIIMDKGDEKSLAQRCYEKAVSSDPKDPMLSNNLAYFYAERQINLPQSEKLARFALSKAPNDPNIQDTMGWVLYQQGKYAEAEKHIRNSVKGSPDNADLRYHLGAVYAALGKAQEAKIELKKCMLISPLHIDAQLLLNMLRDNIKYDIF